MNHRKIGDSLGISARTLLHWRKARPKLYRFIVDNYERKEEVVKVEKEDDKNLQLARGLVRRVGELLENRDGL